MLFVNIVTVLFSHYKAIQATYATNKPTMQFHFQAKCEMYALWEYMMITLPSAYPNPYTSLLAAIGALHTAKLHYSPTSLWVTFAMTTMQ